MIPTVFLIVFVSLAIVRQTAKGYTVKREIASFEGEIKKLERQNALLEDKLSYYKTVSFLEREARLNLGLKKDDEEVVVVLGQKLGVGVLAAGTVDPKEAYANWEKWFYYFFRKDLIN
ncbi:MAG: Uncharacterized protein G01um101418_380 [Parcubacteria group bacterium Gr01-1014_18]|nr:MAG: Uncharacterized protein Greene041636_374 [Parcubacteria group bacterium Greene0416_36]TSC81101.1 MAG: Uncharacterized protein G01um101418_380 [Parcubacteria group bacterium Gr01-1014_18]TSC98483.1 MAG: Uncharacterized protein Greene101420_720 [Parcubacteria group bacterium Greene1014_20]TSD07352.1 MAG: Uncharacterized protein Greene07142_207 [Parcubacteria group bacterium Greene0714_2]